MQGLLPDGKNANSEQEGGGGGMHNARISETLRVEAVANRKRVLMSVPGVWLDAKAQKAF